MKRRLYYGIDPGLEGAIATLEEGGDVLDLRPVPLITGAARAAYDLARIRDALLQVSGCRRFVTVELLQPLPRALGGSIANFHRGVSHGWTWMLAALGIPYQLVQTADLAADDAGWRQRHRHRPAVDRGGAAAVPGADAPPLAAGEEAQRRDGGCAAHRRMGPPARARGDRVVGRIPPPPPPPAGRDDPVRYPPVARPPWPWWLIVMMPLLFWWASQ